MKKHIITCLFAVVTAVSVTTAQPTYLSPTRIAVDPTTQNGVVLLSTAQAIARIDLDKERLLTTTPLTFEASDFAYSGNGRVLVATEYGPAGSLKVLDTSDFSVKKSVAVGAYPSAVCVNEEGTRAWVANRFSNDLSVVNPQKGKELARIPLIREPKSVALSPDQTIVAVGNFLPFMSALDTMISAEVSLIDAATSEVLCHIPFTNGTHSIEDVCFSKDGNYLFVTHVQSRFQIPTTQLERGWMNTNAVSIVDMRTRSYYTTILLDNVNRGAANPAGMTVSEDGRYLYVAIAGTHEVIAVSLKELFPKIENAPKNTIIANDLTFFASVKNRIPLPGKGPRKLIEKDRKVFASCYFSGTLSIVEPLLPVNGRELALGEEPEMDPIRRGEMLFADADICFQNWQSCVTCHPGARADGLNWDLINDGIGNFKNSKSMLYSHETPPAMITGIRVNAEKAVRSGIRYILFTDRPEEEAACMDQYLRSLEPLVSPYRVNGELSKKAQQGERIFEKAGCIHCHNGAYYTDKAMYDVGTGIDECEGMKFDTPTLNEVWRTAPYLYNGSAKTIREVLTRFNEGDRHGTTSDLSEKEIEALEEYILSL